jgi:hypothetical protein
MYEDLYKLNQKSMRFLHAKEIGIEPGNLNDVRRRRCNTTSQPVPETNQKWKLTSKN